MQMSQIQAMRDKPEWKKQQGDVIIRKVTADVAGMGERKMGPGESLVPSTNPHMVAGARVFVDKESGAIFLTVARKGIFKHRQHGPITVGKGTYFVEPKVEIDAISDMQRPVQD